MSNFEVVRSTVVQAPPEQVHELIADFRRWREWSPWEDLDPALQREYSEPSSGVGASYAWQGNRKAGQGRMEIAGDSPERIAIVLTFLKPWKGTNDVAFELAPSGDGAEVTWRMTGSLSGLAGVFGKVLGMDRLVGRDFEKGLARLKAAAEGERPAT